MAKNPPSSSFEVVCPCCEAVLSVENEKNKSDLLEKKFQEAVRRAKETPDTPGKPLRDFDLD
ncbi:MAG: hypothetical protein ABSD96_21355 [Candidatus Korobacteraceae bacterium]